MRCAIREIENSAMVVSRTAAHARRALRARRRKLLMLRRSAA